MLHLQQAARQQQSVSIQWHQHIVRMSLVNGASYQKVRTAYDSMNDMDTQKQRLMSQARLGKSPQQATGSEWWQD